MNPGAPSNNFLKILNMGPISSRKHEMEILGNLDYGINIFQKTSNMKPISSNKDYMNLDIGKFVIFH